MKFTPGIFSRWFGTLVLGVGLGLSCAEADDSAPSKFKGATAARVENGYAVVVFEGGRKGVFPMASLHDDERDWLTEYAGQHPLAHGKSTVIVTKTEVQAKTTILRSSTEAGTETVQLCPPSSFRDQLGGTCMLYARIHYLDIAGYIVDNTTLYKIVNNVPTDIPWRSPLYYEGMDRLFTDPVPRPVIHLPDVSEHPFDWARRELRKGRPILAALPQEIWLALPASYLAEHKWDGDKSGHQVVVNGFTYNSETKQGTFHIINSWRDLSEFDLPADALAPHIILMQQSLSPKGEPPEVITKVVIYTITAQKKVGNDFLFVADTNLGSRRVVAPDENSARATIENVTGQ